MENKYVLDMTKGNEISLLLKFTVPMLVGNIFQQFYNMADSMVVGRFVGAKALGAVGVVGNLNFLFFSLCFGLSAGLGILIAQHYGAGETGMVKKIIANSAYITLFSGMLMGLFSVALAKPILRLMNTPAENFTDAYTYMKVVCGATVIVAGYNMISAILRALGDSRTPLIFLVVACVVNIVLDLLFVIVFHWGVAGAAWATVIAQLLSALGSIVYGIKKNSYLKLEKEHFIFDKYILKDSLTTGIPLAVQNALIAVSCVALQSVVNQYGTAVMAAYTATSRVEQLVQQPFQSLSAAVSTFAGQNVGAGKNDRVITCCKKSLGLVAVFSILMVAVMYLFGEQIIGLFVSQPEVIAVGERGLQITSWMYIALGVIYVTRGMLNGVGDAGYAMINGAVEVAGRIGFAWLLMMIPAVGVWGIWYTNGLTWILAGSAGAIRFCQGKWKTLAKVRTEKRRLESVPLT